MKSKEIIETNMNSKQILKGIENKIKAVNLIEKLTWIDND